MSEAIALREAVDALSKRVEESLAAGGDGSGQVAGELGIPGDQLTEVAFHESTVVAAMVKDGLPLESAAAGMAAVVFMAGVLWERGHRE